MINTRIKNPLILTIISSFRTIELSDPSFEKDGLRFMTIKTPHLKGRGDICLYVPEVESGITNLPIYILLHGVYGSAWVWAMKGGAHRTAKQLIENQTIQPAILAMPSDGLWGDGSAYFSHHGSHFDEWIVSDVPQAIIENIPEAGESSPLCIGGLSMGGYGALSLGSRFPDRFQAISGHSSITQLNQMDIFVEEALEEYLTYSEWPDVIDSIKANQDIVPPLRFDCGKSDILIEHNRALHLQLKEINFSHIYEEFEGGHEWPYWQTHIARSLVFFDEKVYL